MRIDSSSIGMESARAYSSVSGRINKFVITNGRQSLKDGTGALFGNLLGTDVEEENTQAKEKENPEEDLQSRLEEMQSKIRTFSTGSIRTVDAQEAQKQLRDIRQQCLIFLMNILFPDRRSSSSWDKTQSQDYQTAQTSTSGSIISSVGVNVKTLQYSRQYYYEETEDTCFSTQGTVKCADGRKINFNLNLEMSRSFQEYYEETLSMKQVSVCDPLVINLDGNIAQLSDQTFLFDLDGDGEMDEINRLSAGSGFLALDKNGDGEINDGTELFGTSSGNGFSDLAAYDEDHNGFIDEGDEIWDKLKIWVMDENGNRQLYSLAEKGVGAICLQNASTDFTLTGGNNQTGGIIRNTGIFLYENGNVGTVQHVDLALHGKENTSLNMVV
ncbi:MAG: hypothetical protein Q4D94_00605 [Bacillota bacterium]|nr:hypothetical protein [Bacillota bacterium]